MHSVFDNMYKRSILNNLINADILFFRVCVCGFFCRLVVMNYIG